MVMWSKNICSSSSAASGISTSRGGYQVFRSGLTWMLIRVRTFSTAPARPMPAMPASALPGTSSPAPMPPAMVSARPLRSARPMSPWSCSVAARANGRPLMIQCSRRASQ